jgi:hypothetical protein
MNYATMKFLCITLFLWIGSPLSATATEAEAGSSERGQAAVGTRTTQWLDIQRDGRAAGNLLPILGAEAGLSYRRYINSFTKPIPDQLLPEAPVSSAQK